MDTLTATGNEVMQAGWSKVEGADGYKIIVYKNDSGSWVDSGYSYELDTSNSGDRPVGMSYDEDTGYRFNMALTVGGTAEDGSGTLLTAGRDYKIAVLAGKTTDGVKYYSQETRSDAATLPEYTPLDMEIVLDGTSLVADSDTQIYTGYISYNGAGLHMTPENADYTVKLMDGTSITPINGSFPLPDFEGTLMLEVTGSVTNGSVTDTTTRYVLIYKDNIAPVISLDKPVFFADAETGSFTVSGITEPGAVIDYGITDEEGNPVTIQAGEDGKFTISDTLAQEGSEPLQYKTLFITAADARENKSAPAIALVNLHESHTLTVNLNGGSGTTVDGEYAENTVISIDAGTKAGCTFKNWTSSDGGSFADANSAGTTFTMPGNDTTITANWTNNGGDPALTDPPTSDNSISGITAGQVYTSGDTVTFTATGGGMSNTSPNTGDKRWQPTSWETNPSGTWSDAPYSASFSTTGMTVGEHTLTVTFTQQRYNGSEWVNVSPAVTDTKSVKFTVSAASGGGTNTPNGNTATGQNDTTKPTTTAAGQSKTGDNSHLMQWLLLLLISGGAVVTIRVIAKRKKTQG